MMDTMGEDSIARSGALRMDLIDIGANLTHSSFAPDRDAVIRRALDAGVGRMIVTGADLETSRQALEMANGNATHLWSTAGVHPHHASGFAPPQAEDFVELSRSPKVVAVGECGLDYYRNLSAPDVQRAAFAAQLQIAVASAKPVFLHQRDAHEDFLAILREYAGSLTGGVAHCFTGGPAELEDYLALGLHIGVTGWVCDPARGQALREAVPRIPLQRLMIETDAPYLTPRDLSGGGRSRRNEPGNLPHIAAALASLRDEPLESLATSTTANAIRFFNLEKPKTGS
jgi:TatD DNase family protein